VSGTPIYEFEDVRVDIARLLVLKEGRPIDLEPKTFDVLRFLIEHRDRLVGKEELLNAVWPDTFVTPNVLTRAVAQLRKAIGDDAREPRVVETVATRGYRFIASVTEVADGRAPIEAPVEAPRPASSLSPPFTPSPAPPPFPSSRAPGHPTRKISRVGVLAALALGLAIAAGIVAWNRAGEPGSPVPTSAFPTVRRLASSSATYAASPSLSPDGRAVAYVSNRTGALEISVVSLVPGSREVAITSDGGQNVEPDWSPDGQWIAYRSLGRGGIWTVPATGGSPRQVIEFGSQPAWSPDSQTIAFRADTGATDSRANLWTVNRDGTGRREVTRIGTPDGGHHGPSWSRDGRFLAFVLVDRILRTSMWTVHVADGRTRKMWEGNGVMDRWSARFGPGDAALYWSSVSREFNVRIWKLPLTGADHEPASPPQPVFANDEFLEGLSISRTGQAAYGAFTEDASLWSLAVRADGSIGAKAVRLTTGTRSSRASYSPDGQIAFARLDVGVPVSVWAVNEDGREPQPLVTEFPAFMPQWVRDGSRLLVLEVGGPVGRLWWVDGKTRRATPIPFSLGNMTEPRISPDGRTLAFHVIEPNGNVQVWTQPVDGGARQQITSGEPIHSYPNWSPDGNWLVVQITRGNDTNIGVVSSRGGPVEQLTNERGWSWPTTWSPDGEWIAFAGERGGVWNLWTVSRRTREIRKLTQYTSASGYVRWPSWSPRGDRIVFERNERTASVWLTQLP
jgi:Tol biopolymer transport system component/DNA-binding winged helix-turn-helix (wHTH) protein